LIEKVPLGLANFLVGPLSLGLQRTAEAEYVVTGSCCAQLLWML
jgi:hypothetical protein